MRIKHPADLVVANARNVPHRARRRTMRQFFHNSTALSAQGNSTVPFEAKPNSCGLFENTRNDKSDLTMSATRYWPIACHGAITQQLGLFLQSCKDPVDVLVIDYAKKIPRQ